MNDTEIEAIRRGPALAPPAGVQSNFVNPPNRNVLAVAVISACASLTTIFFLCRIYTRVFYIKKARLEDFIGLLGFPFFIAAAVQFALMTDGPGLFLRQWNMREIDFEGFIYSYVVIIIQYCVGLALFKIAIILEWVYLFVPRATHDTFYWVCYGMIGANCSLYLATILCTDYACTPREKIWRRYLPGTCIDVNTFNAIITSVHLVFDLMMLLVPHRIIWKLALSARQRTGVSAVFSVGIMNCLCAAGRVASAVKTKDDLTYDFSTHLVWGTAECATAGIIFCVPALPIAFREKFVFPSINLRLREKMGGLFSQDTSATSSQRLSRPQQGHRGTPPDVNPWLDEDSVVNLTRLQPVRTRSSERENQLREEGYGSLYDGGILRTTEIAIITTENPELAMKSRPGPPQPWLDCDSSD
ncbi:hypothetical protein F4805DRAFT_48677 [Annulohypoxylon moriforme]|nr:hypothetical protein F4805DRAFT_48677 [Annulohypoxylon moriforme]